MLPKSPADLRTYPLGRRVWVTALLFAFSVLAAHAQTYERGPARSPHGPLSISCNSCHTSTSWSPLRNIPEFNHDVETRYPLRGLHESVQCRLCHTKLVFKNIGAKCADCHADIHRRQFGARCEECHTVTGWRVAVQSISQHQNRFPLAGAHATLDCESCHRGAASGRFTGLSTDCVSCHLKDYEQARPLNHREAGLPLACGLCHTMDNWRTQNFDHARFARFPLEGAHARIECAVCHTGGRFRGTPVDCFGCHARDFASARNPDHVKAGFPKECATCHTTSSWQGARFDHNTLTRFTLTGAHVQVECTACHQGGRFAGTPMDCYGCHASHYQAATNPNHVRSNFPTDCARCHTTERWQGAQFDHSLARFPLTGAHVQVACSQCHVNGQFTGTSAQCSGCHLADYTKTTNPNHAAAGFPQNCEICHNTARWQGASFDHSKTKFALTGAHVQVACSQCHVNNRFAGTPGQCSGCHLADYTRTTNPNHAAAGFPQNCEICHNTARWQGASFDHSKTKFALTGAHVQVACSQCHVNNRFAGTADQCQGCHLADYNRTSNPNHVAAGFPQNCAVCHTTAQWNGTRFDHSAATRFPLTGAHIQVACNQCHLNNRFAGTPAQCEGCHLEDYNSTANPNHAAAGFPQNCALCHTTAQWQGARFDHNTATRFPLTGAHVQVACSQCHAGNKFAGTSSECQGCHLNDYNRTTNPNHRAAGFPQDCSICHSTSQWLGAKFDHSRTSFPLTGRHTSVACSGCHASGVYSGLNTACVSCHLNEYNRTTNPNHRSAGFPQQCQVCHTTSGWTPASFNHSTTGFPLTGKHTSTPCASCHIGGKYAGTPTACYSCHRTEYETTTNPNHRAAGFPQDCSLCHTTSGWPGARFNHSFPIYTGKHAGKWTTCNDCHTNPNNYQVFSCINCHAHEKTSMDSKHANVQNYVYNSTNCYQCHPQGSS